MPISSVLTNLVLHHLLIHLLEAIILLQAQLRTKVELLGNDFDVEGTKTLLHGREKKLGEYMSSLRAP